MRNLTITEQKDLLEQVNAKKHIDVQEDVAFRYVSDRWDIWEAFNINTLHTLLVRDDAHICNVLGNMNYTKAYKLHEQNKY